jgi:hypothetical protein
MLNLLALVLVATQLLSIALAEPFSGYVAVNGDATEIMDPDSPDDTVVSMEYLADGEAKIAENAFSFKAGVLYDNFDDKGEYFDGTLELLMDGGNVITIKFNSASVGNELDTQGFFTIMPSPLQGQVVSGEQDFKGVTGTVELRGRMLPGGHGPTFYNFDGELTLHTTETRSI